MKNHILRNCLLGLALAAGLAVITRGQAPTSTTSNRTERRITDPGDDLRPIRERCPTCGRVLPNPIEDRDRIRMEANNHAESTLRVPGDPLPYNGGADPLPDDVGNAVYRARDDQFMRIYAAELKRGLARDTAIAHALDAVRSFEAWLAAHPRVTAARQANHGLTESGIIEPTTKEYQACHEKVYDAERNRNVPHELAMEHATQECTRRETRTSGG